VIVVDLVELYFRYEPDTLTEFLHQAYQSARVSGSWLSPSG
jgi:hypothetical protein